MCGWEEILAYTYVSKYTNELCDTKNAYKGPFTIQMGLTKCELATVSAEF